MIRSSDIQQNLTCAHQCYSLRLTIRYWCPAEWISIHIQTDIPQIPSVICWSTEKYHLQEEHSVKICVSNTARFSTTEKHRQINNSSSENLCLKHCKIFELWNRHLTVKFDISTTVQSRQLRIKLLQLSANILRKSKWIQNYTQICRAKRGFTQLSQ